MMTVHFASLLPSVRALVRDPSRVASLPAGIELAVGDLDDPETVSKAVAGVEATFLMQVGGGTEQTRTIVAARDAAVPRIILLSSAGARLLPLDANPMGPLSRLASRPCASPALA
jgi:uncharacterized protein YbjT (DUF2867 family)